MKKIDFYSLDGRGLKTFLVVLEEMSVSRAAERLGVTQSAVSHTLDKLRLALGDPLFVRSGRGIAATERAVSLQEPVRQVLDDLKGLTDQRVFDPSIGTLELTIAANDFGNRTKLLQVRFDCFHLLGCCIGFDVDIQYDVVKRSFDLFLQRDTQSVELGVQLGVHAAYLDVHFVGNFLGDHVGATD